MINALTGDSFPTNFRALLRAIDALLLGNVVNLTTSAPPGSPANGDAYVVKATGTGAWAGQDNAIAIWTTDDPANPSGVWDFYPAARGMIVCNTADSSLYFYNGTAWTAVGGGGGSFLPLAGGVLTGQLELIADSTNGKGIFIHPASFVPHDNGALWIWHSDGGNTTEYFDSNYDNAAAEILFRMRVYGTAVDVLQMLGSGEVSVPNGKLTASKGLSTGTAFWSSGTGSPETVVTAPVGSMYTDLAGGAGTTFYVKETGVGNTGWSLIGAGGGMSNPMTTLGDLIAGGAAGAPGRLAVGSNGQVLKVVSGAPAWAAAGGGGGSLPFAQSTQRLTIITADGASEISLVTKIGDTCTAVGASWTAAEPATATNGVGSSRYDSSADTYAGWYGSTPYYVGRNANGSFGLWLFRTTDIRLWVGFHDGPSGLTASDSPSGKFAMFRFSSIGGDTNYQCVCGDGSAQTVVDSGVAADTHSHAFGVQINDVGSNVMFYIDKILVATITTHIPASGTQLKWTAQTCWHTSTADPMIGMEFVNVQSDC